MGYGTDGQKPTPPVDLSKYLEIDNEASDQTINPQVTFANDTIYGGTATFNNLTTFDATANFQAPASFTKGIVVSGSANLDGELNINGNITASSGGTFEGTSEFTFTAPLLVGSGSSLTSQGPVVIGGSNSSLSVSSAATFTAGVSFTGTSPISFGAPTTWSNTATFEDGVTIEGGIIVEGGTVVISGAPTSFTKSNITLDANSNLTVGGQATFSNSTQFNETATFSNSVNVSGDFVQPSSSTVTFGVGQGIGQFSTTANSDGTGGGWLQYVAASGKPNQVSISAQGGNLLDELDLYAANTVVKKDLTVGGTATFDGQATFSGTVGFNETATFSDGLNVPGGTTTLGENTYVNSNGDIVQNANAGATLGFGGNAGVLRLGSNGGQNAGGMYLEAVPSSGMPNELNITGSSAGNLDVLVLQATSTRIAGTVSSSQGQLGNASDIWEPTSGTFNVAAGTVINIATVPSSNINYKVATLKVVGGPTFVVSGFMLSGGSRNAWSIDSPNAYPQTGYSPALSFTSPIPGSLITITDESYEASGYFQINAGEFQFVVVSSQANTSGAVMLPLLWMTN